MLARESDFNEFAVLFVVSMQNHVDFTNEPSGLNDSDLLIEAFHLNCFNNDCMAKRKNESKRGVEMQTRKKKIEISIALGFELGFESNRVAFV